MRRALACLLVVLSGALALADEVVLTNGRVVKGKILRQNTKQVVIRSARGKLTIPRGVIAEIVSSTSPLRAFSERRAALGAEDAAGRDKLADWAAANGLGREAIELRNEARSLGLAQRIARAEARDTARAFVSVFHWGRRSGVDRKTLVAILAAGRQRDAKDAELASAAYDYARQLADEEESLRKAAAALRRPRYKDPKNTDTGRGLTKTWRPLPTRARPQSADELDEERARVAAARAAMRGYARSRESKKRR